MKKFLIGGVSLFAILSANNAMAAGYTCEELIEYTSCNPGYYLSKQTISYDCQDGYDFVTGFCGGPVDGLLYSDVTSQEECYRRISEDFGVDASSEPDTYYFYQYACVSQDMSEVHYSVSPDVAASTCSECPAGSICAGGTVAAAPCPAGSYCATTKLKEPTGLCALNSYSTGGAIACTSCPATELTDKDGQTVLAKTAATGTDTPAKCFIDPNAYFKNTKGTYHFKSNCAFDLASQPSCEYYGMFVKNNPGDYNCKEDSDYDEDSVDQIHYTCDSDDSDCMKNHIQNCNLYRTAYENEECDDDGCTVDLGNGITCRYTY